MFSYPVSLAYLVMFSYIVSDTGTLSNVQLPYGEICTLSNVQLPYG